MQANILGIEGLFGAPRKGSMIMDSISAVLDQRRKDKDYWLARLEKGAQHRRATQLQGISSNDTHLLKAPTRARSTSQVDQGTTTGERSITLTSQTEPTAGLVGVSRVRPATSSIESSVGTNNTSIELPPEIDALIDNKAYRNKFKSLIRKGYLQDLLELAEIALTKDQPSHWFAKATKTTLAPGQEGLTMWERTLKYLAKLRNIQQMAERVAAKIGTTVTKGIYKQIWRGANVERWADTVAEMKHLAGQRAGKRIIRKDTDPAKYFMWLCGRELAVKEGGSL
jgi:hypothetical protein